MSEKLKVALVQTAIAWENPELNRNVLKQKLNSITDKVDLIILPEMFTSGFTMHPEKLGDDEGQKTIDWMRKISRNKKCAITGSIVYSEENVFRNRLFFIEENGKITFYDKRHTFTLAGESKTYKPGDEKVIIDFKGFRICPLICYDLRFPVWARNSENYDIVLYVANWPKPRINAWDTLLKARAIENMAYCIGVNRIGTDEVGQEYPGHSAVYDVLGNEVVFSKNEEIIYASLSKELIKSSREKLKFLEDQDAFTLIK